MKWRTERTEYDSARVCVVCRFVHACVCGFPSLVVAWGFHHRSSHADIGRSRVASPAGGGRARAVGRTRRTMQGHSARPQPAGARLTLSTRSVRAENHPHTARRCRHRASSFHRLTLNGSWCAKTSLVMGSPLANALTPSSSSAMPGAPAPEDAWYVDMMQRLRPYLAGGGVTVGRRRWRDATRFVATRRRRGASPRAGEAASLHRERVRTHFLSSGQSAMTAIAVVQFGLAIRRGFLAPPELRPDLERGKNVAETTRRDGAVDYGHGPPVSSTLQQHWARESDRTRQRIKAGRAARQMLGASPRG